MLRGIRGVLPMVVMVTMFGGCDGASPASSSPDASSVSSPNSAPPSQRLVSVKPFDGEKTLRYLTELCNFGPRPSGSEGMRRQQELLANHFGPLVAKTGGRCGLQPFTAADPRDQTNRAYANFYVEWYPQRRNRILLCAHYDTLPYPMRDPIDPNSVFVGANDGASGVAVLMTLGESIAETLDDASYGVDFVLFDAEEFRFRQNDPFFLGSTFFAKQYGSGQLRTQSNPSKSVATARDTTEDTTENTTKDTTENTTENSTKNSNVSSPPSITDTEHTDTEHMGEDSTKESGEEPIVYHAAVLLDMVGDADLRIFQERYSLECPASKPIVRELWNVAQRLKIREFVSRPRHWVQDDHVALYEEGGIPACDVIDFDYGPWHTRADTPDQCSAKSLGQVGVVVREWLRTTRLVPREARDRDFLRKDAPSKGAPQ